MIQGGGSESGELESLMRMTKWELEFELDKNRFTIKYNTPIVAEKEVDGE